MTDTREVIEAKIKKLEMKRRGLQRDAFDRDVIVELKKTKESINRLKRRIK